MEKFRRLRIKQLARAFFWFSLGSAIGLFFFASFLFIMYRNTYANTVYPGIFIGGTDFSGKTKDEVAAYFAKKNQTFADTLFTIKSQDQAATVSARSLGYGYDSDLLANQAFSIGRSQNFLSNLSLLLQAYTNGIYLKPSYHYDQDKLAALIQPMRQSIDTKPVNAVFNFENNRVSEFRPHSDGHAVDQAGINEMMSGKISLLLSPNHPKNIVLPLPVKTIKPKLTIDKVNNMGIKELIGSGTSLFEGSIENRIYNISLAASRLNGVLIAPGDTFSFAKAVGDISSLTGYKQAYVIENGKTILGDGGGVCQVSTTLFRAALNSGLPITERHPHAYRVHYYEEDQPVGIDAAVYVPSVDLKFKNDTGHWVLIQTVFNADEQRLTFNLYGTSDGREVEVDKPVILSQSPAPPPLYQDDPTLPKGQVKQVDFSAAGANVYFTREVRKNGKTIISDKFTSNYRPWQAVYLRGTM